MREPKGTVDLRRSLSEEGIELTVLEDGQTCSVLVGDLVNGPASECGRSAQYNTAQLTSHGWSMHNRCDEHLGEVK